MPSPFQLLRLRKDSPHYHPGFAAFFPRYNFTGMRRQSYILHERIGFIEGIIAAVAYSGVAFSHPNTTRWHFAAITFGLVIIAIVVHLIVMLIKGETYWQLRVREVRASRDTAQNSKQELLDFARKMQQKGKI